MDWSLALNVTITGFVLVFGMLLLLVFVLLVFGWISVAAQKAAQRRLEKKRAEALSAVEDVVFEENADSAQETSTLSADDSGNIIAAISAAVAYLYAGSGKKPVIKSVKKSSARRSAWANAGIADNTRTF